MFSEQILIKNTLKSLALFILGLSWIFGLLANSLADVVKPALVEISVNTKGYYEIELRASIEALLTGIDGRRAKSYLVLSK